VWDGDAEIPQDTVDDQVVDDDKKQRQTQDGEDEPAPFMDAGV